MDSYEHLYNSVCRLCLRLIKSDNMVPLFDKNSGKTNNYAKAVTRFSKIIFENKDYLPKSMCKICLIQLKQCISFKFTCESSERILKIMKNFTTEDFKQKVVEYSLFKCNNLTNCFSKTGNSLPQNTRNKSKFIQNVQKSKKKHSHTNSASDWLNEFRNEIIDNNMPPKLNTEHKKTDNPDKIIDALEKSITPFKPQILNIKPRRKFRRVIWKRVLTKNQSLIKNSHICKICNKVLANQNTYENHMQRHNGFRYICEHCGKGFPVLAELHMHLVARHGTGPFLQCQHCPFKAPRKFDLIEHERIHTGERPFTCEKCGLTFRRRGIWKKHLIYHTEKKVQCTACPKKFFLRSQMLTHYNSVHERLYMYVCGKCGALYAKPVTVRRHMMDRHGIPREMQGKILRIKKSNGFKE